MRQKRYRNDLDADAAIFVEMRMDHLLPGPILRAWTVTLATDVEPITSKRSEYTPVARSDHDPASDYGHDVRVEGVHVDVLDRDGDTVRTIDEDHLPGDPPETVTSALKYVERHFSDRYEDYLQEFENQ